MTVKKWQHDELAHDLAKKFRVNGDKMVWEDMNMGSSGSCRPDVYVINKTYSYFQPLTYEIKVSLSDFRSDITSGKWQKYLKFSAGVVFAVPKGLITKNDVPNGCGLIVRSDTGWRHAKKPTLSQVDSLPHETWMKMMIDGIERVQREQIKVRPSASSWAVEAKLRNKFGHEIASLIAKVFRSEEELQKILNQNAINTAAIKDGTHTMLQNEIRNLKQNDQYLTKASRDFAKMIGLGEHFSNWQIESQIRDLSEKLNENTEIRRLRNLFNRLKIMVDGCAEEPIKSNSPDIK